MDISRPKKEAENDANIREDEALVVRAQEGDATAFDELVLKYNKRLYGLIFHMTQSREDSYDILQDVFAKAYRSIKRFKGNSTFYTWIYSISVNTAINHLKKMKRKAAISLDDEDKGVQNDDAIQGLSARDNPRKETDLRLLQKKLNEALLSLSNDHRAVVIMFDIQGIPHAEISRILCVTEGTVRSRLFYAHKNLQAQLQEFKEQL